MRRATWDIMIGRLRQEPGRAWLTTTPKGFNWIYDLFVTRELPDYSLVRSTTRQNPYLPGDFVATLEGTYAGQFRQQEIEGEFVQPEGALAQRWWFEVVDAVPAGARRVRAWDFAATEKKLNSDDPDFTAGVKVAYHQGIFYVEDVVHERLEPGEVDRLVLNTVQADGPNVLQRLEQEPGSAGKRISHYMIQQLAGYNVKAVPVTGDKVTRAMPWLAQAQAGNVKVLRAHWNEEWLSEVELFPMGAHDDMVDGTSDATDELVGNASAVGFMM